MSEVAQFREAILKGYPSDNKSIVLGGAMFNGDVLNETYIQIPLKTMNRHGLIAGATGTGKTKTLQVLAEQLSENGVPTVLMDLKGDLSGLARPGKSQQFITERHQAIGLPHQAAGMPVELMGLTGKDGVHLRATVSEFGPVLFSKILELNDTQSGVVSIIFKYCDDNNLPLLDLKDFKRMLQYASEEGKDEIKKQYGLVSSTTVSSIMRSIVQIEQQGADVFFGEKSFDVADFLGFDEKGRGTISIIRLTDIQDKPKLFSTFMLSLLAEIYNTFPEAGDIDKPRLVLFIDEAHLIFREASSALLNQIEAIVKLIRSKGVGIYFCTQSPADVPDVVLSQLGLKVQHALRAFTAKDRKDIVKAAENFPISSFYKTDEVLTSLGIGEALVTALDAKGRPTPLAVCCMRAPMSRMDVLTSDEIEELVSRSQLVAEYNKVIDRDSAFEILEGKINRARNEVERYETRQYEGESARRVTQSNEPNLLEELSKNTMVRQIGRTVVNELMRGLLGTMGFGSGTRRRR